MSVTLNEGTSLQSNSESEISSNDVLKEEYLELINNKFQCSLCERTLDEETMMKPVECEHLYHEKCITKLKAKTCVALNCSTKIKKIVFPEEAARQLNNIFLECPDLRKPESVSDDDLTSSNGEDGSASSSDDATSSTIVSDDDSSSADSSFDDDTSIEITTDSDDDSSSDDDAVTVCFQRCNSLKRFSWKVLKAQLTFVSPLVCIAAVVMTVACPLVSIRSASGQSCLENWNACRFDTDFCVGCLKFALPSVAGAVAVASEAYAGRIIRADTYRNVPNLLSKGDILVALLLVETIWGPIWAYGDGSAVLESKISI